MELGIKDNEQSLYNKAEDVADNVLDNLEVENGNKLLQKNSSNVNKNSFTMNVYCQNLNKEELDNIFNYINKRFGLEY